MSLRRLSIRLIVRAALALPTAGRAATAQPFPVPQSAGHFA
jgi:hypothetical protein